MSVSLVPTTFNYLRGMSVFLFFGRISNQAHVLHDIKTEQWTAFLRKQNKLQESWSEVLVRICTSPCPVHHAREIATRCK